MFWPCLRCVALLILFCGPLAGQTAWAKERPNASELGIDEQKLTQKARAGRLKTSELIRLGEKLSWFSKLKIYLDSKELEPYFLGLEDALRDMARTDPNNSKALAKSGQRVFAYLSLSRKRLVKAARGHLELEWRRGLTGLIFLDHDWRRRVYDQNKEEIKNPYDLVRLLDCMDARLRGLDQGDPLDCPLR
jgi:hypothetical protein